MKAVLKQHVGPNITERIINLKEGSTSTVVGTLYKQMPLLPSVLEEYAKEVRMFFTCHCSLMKAFWLSLYHALTQIYEHTHTHTRPRNNETLRKQGQSSDGCVFRFVYGVDVRVRMCCWCWCVECVYSFLCFIVLLAWTEIRLESYSTSSKQS